MLPFVRRDYGQDLVLCTSSDRYARIRPASVCPVRYSTHTLHFPPPTCASQARAGSFETPVPLPMEGPTFYMLLVTIR
jgi:hypothetical protein